jgi:photosystem II oxygen-evolving enhancer protein 1
MRYRALIVAFLALCLSVLTACSEGPTNTTSDNNLLTYDQIIGTGLANKCTQLDETLRGTIPIDKSKPYTLTSLCLQPTSFLVKEEAANKRSKAEYIPAKVMTRSTSSLDQVQGKLKPNSDGSLTFVEEDGIDFQAITVQLPGGERVPFLFTIKDLVATTQPGLENINTSTDFEGKFKVPSYRTSNFLDPRGRGLAAGYDSAVGLPAQADREDLLRENIKRFDVGEGEITLQIAKINSATGEIAGTFESEQPSESDMGSRDPLDVKIRGLFYGRIEPAQA